MNDRRFIKVAEIRIGLLFANVVAIIVAVPVAIAAIVGHIMLHGFPVPTLWQVVSLAVGHHVMIVVHELLHGVGYTGFAGLSWSQVKFGINWKALTPYCNCLVPVRLSTFRLVGLLPTLVLFPASVVFWLIWPMWWLALLAATTLVGGTGDVIMLIRTLPYPSRLFIVEHPSGIGGDLFAFEPQHQNAPQP